MKKYSKLLAILLVAALALTLCACGSKTETTPAAETKPAAAEPAAETTTEEAPAAEAEAEEAVEPITINLACTFPAGNVNYVAATTLADKVAELTDGVITFNFLGGSEIFSGAAGAEAVMNGALDAAFTAADYFTGFAPEAAAICASNMTYDEMLASGGLDMINEIFAESDVRLLYVVDEVGISGTQIFVNEPVSSLEDLKGLTIRTTGTVQGDILTSLGCTATPLGLGEIFTGLEQGLIEGYCGPAYLGGAMGFFEYCKCVINTEIARGGSSLIINADLWESMSAAQQELLMGCFQEVNAAEIDLYTTYVENNRTALTDAGGTIVDLSDEEAAELKQLCDDYAWKSIENTVDADTYTALVAGFVK